MSAFTDFPLRREILQGIEAAEYERPLPIQTETIPAVLEGQDVVARSQTGTGKTAAFLIPAMESLLDMTKAKSFRPLALVLLPTRELAAQVHDHFQRLAVNTRLRAALVIGGANPLEEEKHFQSGVEFLIATPGRLLDHLGRGGLKLSAIQMLVLDEADRMLDAGFLPEVRKIIDQLPADRQTLLFSATMPSEMERLAREILRSPKRIDVDAIAPRDTIQESFWPVPEHQKSELLKLIFAQQEEMEKTIVFVRTRQKARRLTAELRENLGFQAAELHAELPQEERSRTLENLRNGEIKLLVATDVASRGLDISGLSHVVNYDVPNTVDDYIHRVGRTGRVDRSGVAITLVSPAELALSLAIENSVRRKIPIQRIPGFAYEMPEDEEESFHLTQEAKKRTAARKFIQREFQKGKKKKPFTKTGQLIPELREKDEDKPRRNYKKRMEKRILNKKLPHQRKRK